MPDDVTPQNDPFAEAMARSGDGIDALVNGMAADEADRVRMEAATGLHRSGAEETPAEDKPEDKPASEAKPDGEAEPTAEEAAAAAAAAKTEPEGDDKPTEAEPKGDEDIPAWAKEIITKQNAAIERLTAMVEGTARRDPDPERTENREPTRAELLIQAVDGLEQPIEALVTDYPDLKLVLGTMKQIMGAMGQELQQATQNAAVLAHNAQQSQEGQIRQQVLAHPELGDWLRQKESGGDAKPMDMAAAMARALPKELRDSPDRFDHIARMTRAALGLPEPKPEEKPEDKPAATVEQDKTETKPADEKPEDKPTAQRSSMMLDELPGGGDAAGSIMDRLGEMSGLEVEAAMLSGQIKHDDFVAFLGR